MAFSKKKSNRSIPAEFRDAERGIRLQKAMAEAGTASRRDCEKMIEQGRVTVNGQPVAGLPAWVDPFHDRIELDGKALRKPKALPSAHPSRVISSHSKNNPTHSLNTLPGDKVYVMLHKPRQTITTTDDPDKRRNVMDLVPVHELPGSPRLFPVGRLDADSTGLLLLTNDGELANRLTHPRYGIRKTYLVSIKGRIEQEHIEQLKRGLFLAQRSDEGRMSTRPGRPPRLTRPRRIEPVKTTDGKPTPIKKVQVDQVKIVHRQQDRSTGDRTLLEVTLHEGHNRIIRRVLARLGLKVRRLQRIAIGPLKLEKLPIGHARLLTPLEVKALYRASGMLGSTPAAKA